MQTVDLHKILNQSQFISQELSLIKKNLVDNSTSSNFSQTPPSKYIERAINLRIAFRNLADGIETNRNLVQIQKEKIEKSKIYIEGLHYYKSTILDRVKDCEIELVNVSEYVDKKIEIRDWVDRFEEKEELMVRELDERREKQRLYEQLIGEKAKKEQEIREKKQLYEKVLPSHAKRILDQIQQTSKYFNVEDYEQFEGIANHHLATVFDKLNPLRSKNVVELHYSKDQFEQIEVVLCKNDYKYYKQATLNKIPILQNEIRFTISSIAPHYDKLVIGLDRREDFSNEEVFQRLANQQLIRPIFIAPQSELQRNINAKYVRLDWFDHLFLTGIISPQALLDLIKERVFCLKFMSFITQNIKKLSFFFPLNTDSQTPIPNNIKKVSFGSLEKIPFESYFRQIYHPEWLQKYISSLTGSMRGEGEEENRMNLLNLLGQLKMEEAASPITNCYYKGCLTVHQNVLEFVLIVPIVYPRAKSYIRITDWHRKKEEEKKAFNLDVPCKFTAKVEGKAIPQRILAIERAVNHQISSFFKGEELNSPFRILIQINRLLTLLAENNERRN